MTVFWHCGIDFHVCGFSVLSSVAGVSCCAGDHANVVDHQVELATALSQAGTTVAWLPGDLTRFLESPHSASLSALSTTAAVALCDRLHTRFNPLQCIDIQTCGT